MIRFDQRWAQILYGPFFKVIGLFYRTYKSNRDRIEKLSSREGVSNFIKFSAVLILFGWILVWLLAPEGSNERLSEEVKETIGGLNSLSE